MKTVEDKVKELVAEVNFTSIEIIEDDAWDNMIDYGMLDSLAVVYLISLIEDEFKIKIPLANLSITDFQSTKKISAIIKECQN